MMDAAIPDKVAVSVVIPCFNAMATLERCLAAVTHQQFESYEIILVDNGSDDGSVELIKAWQSRSDISLKLLHEPVRGAAAARNRGAGEAKGEWLAFTDTDCEPETDWIERGKQLLDSHEVSALAGPAWGTMEGDSSAKVMGLMTLSVGMKEHQISDAGPGGTRGFAAANLWVRASTFHQLKGFDVSLSVSGEDVDFCSRLYQNRETILYSPAIKVNHIHQSGVVHMFRKMISYGRAHAGLLEKYGQPGIHTDLTQRVVPLGSLYLSVQFRSADKKMLFLFLLSLIWWPVMITVPFYILYIAYFLKRRAAGVGHQIGWVEVLWMGCLLIVKSAGMTVGRIAGSRKWAWTL